MTASLSSPLTAPLLLATDGSPSAEVAQQLLYELTRVVRPTAGADAMAILTVRPRNAIPLGRKSPEPDNGESGAEAEGLAELTEEQLFLQKLIQAAPPGCAIAPVARRGRPANTILSVAQSLQAGLIALGQQGTATVRAGAIGNVTAAVARYANRPVLVAPPPTSSGQLQSAPTWHHVLLVVDGSQATQAALAITRQLVPYLTQRVTILCVQPPLTAQYLFGPFATPTPHWQLMQSLQEAQQSQSQQLVHQAEQAVGLSGIEIETLIQMGEPGPAICQVAQERQVDVLILGCDRRPALGKIRLTATGDYVIHHAPCPVLLSRIPRPDPAD